MPVFWSNDMSLTVKETGTPREFKPVPAGAFIGRAFGLVDLGTQTVQTQEGEKHLPKVRLMVELFGEDSDGNPLTVEVDGVTKPMVVSKIYTASLHAKSNLTKELNAWRGKAFTPDELKGFNISKLVGAYGLFNITHNQSKDGTKTYANIAGVSPLPSALKNSKPAPVHENVIFDFDAPSDEVFAALPEWLQGTISQSPEYKAWRGVKPAVSANPAVVAAIKATAPLGDIADAPDDQAW
jgi:hypothetical protein